MKARISMRQRLLMGTIIGGSVLAIAGSAAAQSAPVSTPPQDDSTEIDEVVVTGSRIRRDPTTAPTPLIQVDREQLLNTGQSTVIDYLATIPALSNSLVPSDTTGSLNVGGLALANLRSLGTGRTLTLVDGRRHVGSQGGTLAVDVDTIPRLLIQNIEIVTGGASSVYGADAVSGVLNFILRKDFEGLEFDVNYGMVNQDGQANTRVSALAGANLLDDRLNLYAFGEYEKLDEIRGEHIDWLRESRALATIDVDPTASPNDGQVDIGLFRNVRTMQRLRWGVVNLANNQPGSALSDPDIPFSSCGAVGASPTAANYTNTSCTALNPGHTWVLEGNTARLADFGTRIGVGTVQRVLNIGGDGEPASEYGQYSFVPGSESYRFQAGINLALTDNINGRAEVKHVSEETFLQTQPTFFDIFISDRFGPNTLSAIRGTSSFDIRLSDNAFMPANLKSAIQNNVINIYSQPTSTSAGQLLGTAPAPYARSALRGQDRNQINTRELNRFLVSLDGEHDQILFARNVAWDVGYTYGEVDVINREQATDVERMGYAADAIVDTAGVVNGRPGEIVCRAQVILATGGALSDGVRGGDVRDSPVGMKAIRDCVPLNLFGKGNQSAAALEYIAAEIAPIQRNEQEQLIASVSGQLWDFWGAGSIGVALGAETRREYTHGIGRDRDTAGRFLFLNSGADFPAAEYESEEFFGEISLPLFRDNWLGEYAELSGSYRTFDYTTIGRGDVFGVNLVYRPIADIAFKTSFNSSLRTPDLGENFAPRSQTFANNFADPCTTANINAAANAEWRTNRIANCQALLNAYNTANGTNLSFDFSGATATNTDDFGLLYGTGGIAGVAGGNPFLEPEESESFTFSTVIQPRAVQNLSVVLDYYEIELTNIIASVSAQIAANNCVNGSTLNTAACATIFRRNPNVPFGMGAPTGDPIGGFIQGSINYAKRTTRGLDFSARYHIDLEEAVGRDWGRLSYNLQGSWLIEQKQFNNASNPNDYTQQDSSLFFPRVRLTSALTYAPNDAWSVTWTMDWQTAQDIVSIRTLVNNADSRPLQYTNTGNFARHDFTVRYNVDEQLTLRAGVTNAFDNEQAAWLGSTLYSNFDPYGTRFFVGLNWRPY